MISIHAPRGGSDDVIAACHRLSLQFQSTLPVGGATVYSVDTGTPAYRFQSTLPVGGATKSPTIALKSNSFQSTLPVGGATPLCVLP